MIKDAAAALPCEGANPPIPALTRSPRLDHCAADERFSLHFRHLPRDYSLAIRWLEPSFFLTTRSWN
jgi:hypothetical protein